MNQSAPSNCVMNNGTGVDCLCGGDGDLAGADGWTYDILGLGNVGASRGGDGGLGLAAGTNGLRATFGAGALVIGDGLGASFTTGAGGCIDRGDVGVFVLVESSSPSCRNEDI